MMKENLKIARNVIDAIVEDVKNFVKDNGGFIATTDEKCDIIYAYKIDWEYDDVSEQRVLAVCVENDELMVAMTPYKTDIYDEPLDKDYFNDNEWYCVGSCGTTVLTAQTILSIAECIDQYV
jgi:hypothetical protein